MTDRAKLKARIAALKAKTAARGCTEAEAMAAAEMAAKLMAEHGLADEDLVMSEASASLTGAFATWRSMLIVAIGRATNSSEIILRGNGRQEILFIGRAPGPDIAVYLRDICFRAVERELRVFKRSTFYRRRRSPATRRQAATDFVEAMAAQLAARVMKAFAPSADATARIEAKAALEKRFPKTETKALKERDRRYDEAAWAGWRASDTVDLNRGVGAEGKAVGLLK